MPGETLVVTSAAGAVGSYAVQLGLLAGMRVVGIAGGEKKTAFVRDTLGANDAVDYKSPSFESELAAACPGGVDIYFENTGGAVQHITFNRMNAHGRIIVCGMIADYNTEKLSPGPNWINMIRRRLTMTGFAMPDHWDNVPAMTDKLIGYYQAGKLKYRAHKLEGLESAIEGINLLFTGGNKGKLMVVL